MCVDVCADMRADMCVDMCSGVCVDMRVGMCTEMCADMRTDMCTDMAGLHRSWASAVAAVSGLRRDGPRCSLSRCSISRCSISRCSISRCPISGAFGSGRRRRANRDPVPAFHRHRRRGTPAARRTKRAGHSKTTTSAGAFRRYAAPPPPPPIAHLYARLCTRRRAPFIGECGRGSVWSMAPWHEMLFFESGGGGAPTPDSSPFACAQTSVQTWAEQTCSGVGYIPLESSCRKREGLSENVPSNVPSNV